MEKKEGKMIPWRFQTILSFHIKPLKSDRIIFFSAKLIDKVFALKQFQLNYFSNKKVIFIVSFEFYTKGIHLSGVAQLKIDIMSYLGTSTDNQFVWGNMSCKVSCNFGPKSY